MPTSFALPTWTIGTWVANVDDDQGCRWGVSTQDLLDGTDVKTYLSERPFGEGTYRARSYRKGKDGALQGWCAAPSATAREVARDTFLGLFSDGGQASLAMYNGLSTRTITVELAGKPRTQIWQDKSGFDWILPVYAADPRWLDGTVRSSTASVGGVSTDGLNWSAAPSGGLDWTTGGGLNWGTSGASGVLGLDNPGSAIAYPKFTITGPVTDPLLVNPITGDTVAYSGVVDVGQTLVIDCTPATRAVTLSGVDRFSALTSAQWITIPPGTSITVQYSGSGAGTCVATWQYAYR